MNRMLGALTMLLVPICGLASGCGSQRCEVGPSQYVDYPGNQLPPDACVQYAVSYSKQKTEEREDEERRHREAVQQLLAGSPVQSEEKLKRDLDMVSNLSTDQQSAIRDLGNGVILTAGEQSAIDSITTDEWHAITQLAAFEQWREKKLREAREQTDRARSDVYQYLSEEQAERQADAAEWQAAALWRQHQCLRKLSVGLQCY